MTIFNFVKKKYFNLDEYYNNSRCTKNPVNYKLHVMQCDSTRAYIKML